MARFDAVVVGAGPAGSTAARELAAAGARVLIIDRAEFPRYKACGGGIPLRTERLLPFPIDSVIEDSVHLLDVAYRGRMGFERDSGAPFAHMVMRDRFDALLLEQARTAGAEFRPSTAVRSLSRDGVVRLQAPGFAVEADYFVCADGAHSPVGKMAGLGEDIAECAAWEVEVRADAGALRRYRSRALIELGYRPWGYAWLFPKASVLSFGVVLPREQAGAMKAYVRRFVARLGLGAADVEVARGHKIRFRRGRERIADERVLLAGDAAGLADEFTEEGIFYAIESGRIAARNVLRAMGGGSLTRYQQDIDHELMPELRAARLIAFMFYGMLRRAPRPWMFASGKAPLLWDAFFAVQKGESTYAREVARIPLLPAIAARMLRS
ncbi:MAG: geranylgeranyl reductase family protein [Chloroflexi bacterium]|nr:geranylgeranyl reductase family protein [Chloroflexota bacterium]